jgi:hypothetical protein
MEEHVIPTTVEAMLRAGSAAFACAALTGCAILPAVGLNLAAQGAAALAIVPFAAMQEGAEKDRCQAAAGKGVTITQSLEAAVPTSEGEVRTFEQAHWRLEFEREGYPQVERSRTPVDGTLAVGECSLLLMPTPGTASVRILYELVMDVAVHRRAVTGEAGSMIVKSCSGRYDIFTFRQRQPDKPDPEATTAAAAELTARVAAFHAAAGG